MSSHVSEGLRAVLLDPGSGFGFARDDDVFALDVAVVVVVGLVVVVVNVHERNYLRHDDNFMVLLDLGAVFLFFECDEEGVCVCVCARERETVRKRGSFGQYNTDEWRQSYIWENFGILEKFFSGNSMQVKLFS